ncbi:MAG: PIG-L family deacetylase [Firmicutes bacterium]|nr:PIG-L family deacetylase [Bacillota bacterium]
MHTEIAVPDVALAIGAHPDDIDFHCGATLAKWSALGCEVHYLVLTDGSKGTWDPNTDTALLVETRQKEQQKAYAVITGCEESTAVARTHFLSFVDGELMAGQEAIKAVCEIIRKLKPTVVLGHDPWRRYRLHPDHRNAGFITTDAIVAARDPFFYSEQKYQHFRPKFLFLFEADEADYCEAIDAYEEVKVKALLQHKSQLLSTMDIDLSADDMRVETQIQQFRENIFAQHKKYKAAFQVEKAEAYKLVDGI